MEHDSCAPARIALLKARENFIFIHIAPTKFKNLCFKNLTLCTAAVQFIIKFTKFRVPENARNFIGAGLDMSFKNLS